MADDRLLIEGAAIFTGSEPLGEGSVLLEHGVIDSIGSRSAVDRAVPRLRADGMTLMPGLIDAHVHATAGSAEQALAFGVTTELDMLADPGEVFALRRRSQTDDTMAELRSAGTGVTVAGGYPGYLVDLGYLPAFPTLADAEDAESFVVDRLAEGADYIKVFVDDGTATGLPTPTLTEPALRAVCAAAHHHDTIVVAHALTHGEAELAVGSGIDILGHLFIDRPIGERLLDTIVRSGVAVIPTLGVLDSLFGPLHGPDLLGDRRIEPRLTQASRAYLSMGKVELGPHPCRYDREAVHETVRRLHHAGVPILAGSDAGNPDTAHGASLHVELALLVEAGLTPTQALAAATSTPAATFGLSDRGTLAPGQRADLVLVDGDPTADISAAATIARVHKGPGAVTRA